MFRRKAIVTTDSKELIKNVSKLTGPISYSMAKYFPVSDNTMRHSRSVLIQTGDFRCIKRDEQNYLRPSDDLIEEGGLIKRSPYQTIIEKHDWATLRDGRSQVIQIALLSGAEVRGIRFIHEPSPLNRKQEVDEQIERLMGLLPKEEGEDDYVADNMLGKIKFHSVTFPLFIDKPEYTEWVKMMKETNTIGYLPRLHYTKVMGLLVLPDRTVYLVYYVDDMRDFIWKIRSEKYLRKFLNEGVKTVVRGLFITGKERDKVLLLKKELTKKDKDINHRQIRPAQVFGDDFNVYCLTTDAESIQKLIGRL
jgi:hypothetical protein